MEFGLLGAAAIGVVTMYSTLRYEARRSQPPHHGRVIWDGLLTAMVVGLITGRVVAMLVAGTNPLANPGDVLIVRGGVDTIGATVAGIVAFGVVAREDLWHMADGAAPAAVAGLAGWHGGCLVRGACLGTPSDLPWALAQGGSAVTRHPVELYAAAFLLVGSVVLVFWKRRPTTSGVVAAGALGTAALARFATEPMRLGLGSNLTSWYALGGAMAVVLAAWRRRLGARKPGG